MAEDIAFVLWEKFLNSLKEAESELSTGFPLISYFLEIKIRIENVSLASLCSLSVDNTLKWLYQLNDLLAECRIFALKKSKRRHKNLLQFIALLLDLIFLRKMRRRLNTVNAEFENFLRETRNEEKSVGIDYTNFITLRHTYPEINDMDQNIGFQEQADKLESMLLNQRSELLNIGIVGMGGVGKTTLVKNVLSRPRLQKEFPKTVWICKPDIWMDEDENTDTLTFKILKYVDRFSAFFSQERHLVVLDDVCHLRNINWSLIWLRFTNLVALIVTTRVPEEAEHMAGGNIIKLEPTLTKEACWSIFVSNIRRLFVEIKSDHLGHPTILNKDEDNHWAMLVDTIYRNPTAMPMIRFENPNLEKLRDEIVGGYCQGLPFAAKMLAEFIHQQL